MCWSFFVCCLFPIFSEREQEQNGPQGVSKGCSSETFAYVLPLRQSVVFFVALFAGAQIFCRQFLASSARRVSYSSHLDPRSCKNASLPLSSADTTWMGFHTMVFPSSFWKLLEGSMCNSNPASFSKPEEDTSQKSCLPKLSFSSERKQSTHPSRIFCKPFVAQTATTASFPCRNTTRNLPSLPRTSHFLFAGNSATFCVPPERVPTTVARISLLFASIFFLVSAYFGRLAIFASRAFAASTSFFRCFSSLCQFSRFHSSTVLAYRSSARTFSLFLVESAGILRCSAISCISWSLYFEESLPIAWHFLSRHSHTILPVGGRSVDRSPPFGWSCVGFLDAASIVRAFSSFV